jgi:hypothetical protein
MKKLLTAAIIILSMCISFGGMRSPSKTASKQT